MANIKEMAKHLKDDLLKIAEAAIEGKKILSEKELSDLRMSICEGCPSYSSDSKKCNECGCFMPMKTKFETSTCPKNKW